MDFKDSKTQKIAIVVLVFFIITYFWYSRVYSSYNSLIDVKSQEFETITTNLRNVEMKAKSLEALKVEYTDLLERYHEIEALLPEVRQIPSLLVQLHTASSLTGTRITKVQPLAIRPQEFYNIASFEIEMTGQYHDLGTFVSYVANYPFIANIEKLEIEAQQVGRASAFGDDDEPKEVNKKDETITATFVLSTYFVKEEERLQELAL